MVPQRYVFGFDWLYLQRKVDTCRVQALAPALAVYGYIHHCSVQYHRCSVSGAKKLTKGSERRGDNPYPKYPLGVEILRFPCEL